MDAYPFAVTAAAVMGAAAGWHADRLLHRYDPVRYSASTARTTWLALLGAGSCAFVAARVGVVWAAPATVLLAAAAIPLGAVDIAVQRVPRVVVTAAGLVSAGLLVAAAMLEAEPQRLLTAAAGAAGLWLGFTLLAVCRAMGAGDARLAALLGMQLGWWGWEPVVAGTMLAFVLAAVFVMVSVASRGMRLGARIPFAPFMLIGALLPTTLLE